ncbi:MAG: rod shape-determining protein MreC [Candidatus Taylorbacteria bacterium]|nr:rod shape-determining protein MreC [Candidatus Taylorbacteria bacterium]
MVATTLLVFLIIFNNLRLPFDIGFIQNTRTRLFSKVSVFGSFISQLKTVKNMITENIALKEENNKLLSRIAVWSELENENEFLRSVLNLPLKNSHELIDAKVFNLQFTPEGHNMLIDKGSKDGVKPGDLIISSSMILIGRVIGTDGHVSRVGLITNSDFKVTVKLSGSDITGIARGVMSEGMLLDFISQDDDVNPGQAVVTNGNDLFPPGLIIGLVDSVNLNDVSLFKKVFVKPEFQNIDISRVIIMRR